MGTSAHSSSQGTGYEFEERGGFKWIGIAFAVQK